MNAWVVLATVLSGTFVFVFGQIILQFVIVPVQEFLKTIAAISNARIEHAHVTANPGSLTAERIDETSRHLRKLSAQLHSNLFLVRPYFPVSYVFKLPSRKQVLQASKSLIGLSNSVFSASNEKTYQWNAERWENICDALSIQIEQDDRWPKE
jgi:hypothetical protein